MAKYQYKCDVCEKEFEYTHPMSEVDFPLERTILDTTCCGQRMRRVPTLPILKGFNSIGQSGQITEPGNLKEVKQ
jgi:predicted nucleic acid-binding Zn ribbon protein